MMITVNDLRKYPNGEELVAKVNNGDITLGQAAVLAVQASNPERRIGELIANEINKVRGESVSSKSGLTPEAKILANAINKLRGNER